MSFYDILTIVIFLGLPVVSAVISAKASRKVEEVSEKPVMEKIDPKKLIIYDAILNPKFKD